MTRDALEPDDPDLLPCPVDGCEDTLGACLRRADQVWPDDPHPALAAAQLVELRQITFLQAERPCCTCPPSCDDDDTGDTCIDAACGVCLHGCPAGLDRPCCRDLPHDDRPIDPGGTEPLFPAPATPAAAVPTTPRSAL